MDMAPSAPRGDRTNLLGRLGTGVLRRPGARSHRAASRAPVVVVIGSGGVDVVRALALAGLRSAVIAPADDESRYSRYSTTAFDWDWDLPSERHDGQLLERVLDFGRRMSSPPVLYFCSDQAVVFASRYRRQLHPTYRFVLPGEGLVEDLCDKQRFSSLSTRLRLPVPYTRVVESVEALADERLDAQAFPLIVKPAVRGRAWAESAKALQVDTPEDLRSLPRRLAGHDQRLIVQECVQGAESAIESYHVYVDSEGRIRGEFTGRKIRTLPTELGHSTAVRLTGASDVRDLGRRVIGIIGLRGVAKLDFKRAPDGRLYLLEINPRFSLWHHLGARAGINLPAMVHADLTGAEWRADPSPRAICATWVHPKDAVAAHRAGVPLSSWATWAARCDAKAFWAWNDPLPLVAAGGMWAKARLARR